MANKDINANVKLVVSEFETNSVVVTDDAIIITFTSDWVEKKKTLPFTEAWLKVKDWIKSIIESDDYVITNIRSDIKEWGNLYGLVVNLAEVAKQKQQTVNDAFAKLRAKVWLNAIDPIDAL